MKIDFAKYIEQDTEKMLFGDLYSIMWDMQRMIAAIQLEIKAREEKQIQEAGDSWIEKLIAAGFRALAKQHHPDQGGNAEDMREIINAREWLLKLAKS